MSSGAVRGELEVCPALLAYCCQVYTHCFSVWGAGPRSLSFTLCLPSLVLTLCSLCFHPSGFDLCLSFLLSYFLSDAMSDKDIADQKRNYRDV